MNKEDQSAETDASLRPHLGAPFPLSAMRISADVLPIVDPPRARARARHRLRVLAGPHRGRAYALDGDILTIGRTTRSTIHLKESTVSRRHAAVLSEGPDRRVLLDLHSTNGTFVDGAAVERHTLVPGTRFQIARSIFMYEQLPLAADRHEVGIPVATGPAPRSLGAVAGAAAVGERHWHVVATRSDGSAYEGSLLDDIIRYRALRTRRARGLLDDPAARTLFRVLHARLRVRTDDPPSAAEELACLCCEFIAGLRVDTESCWPCVVHAVGVEGARVRRSDVSITPGMTGALMIPRRDTTTECVELPCRIYPDGPGRLALSFMGEARTGRGAYHLLGKSITEPNTRVWTRSAEDERR